MQKHQDISLQKYYDWDKKVISMPENDFSVDPNGIGYLLHKNMSEVTEKMAQVDILTGETESYASLLQRCIRTAIHMRNLGIKPGDIVTICSENNLNHHVPYIAAFFIGAITACLDPTLSEQDTIYLMNLVKPKIVFVSETAEPLIENACKSFVEDIKICCFGRTKHLEFSDFIADNISEEGFDVYKCENYEDTATIIFSSGTSGMPKGICLSHKLLIYQNYNTPLPSGAIFTTLYWVSSNFNSLQQFLSGKTIPICRYFDPKRILKQIETYKIDNLLLSTTNALVFLQNFPEGRKTRLKNFVMGGSCMPEESLKKLIKVLPTTQIHFAYGQSEMFEIFAANLDSERNIGSVGIPVKGKSYKVVDVVTRENLGFNQRGELSVKSQWCMIGYYKQTANAWDEEGYLKTGDIAYYNEDFHFYIVDRLKEMFKYKSWHIIPAKLEAILHQHPDVELAVVLGIPHPEDDNHVLAIVQVSKDSKSNPEDVKKFVNDKLDERNHIRAGVRFVKRIPLSPTGKFKRRELRDMYLRGEL